MLGSPTEALLILSDGQSHMVTDFAYDMPRLCDSHCAVILLPTALVVIVSCSTNSRTTSKFNPCFVS